MRRIDPWIWQNDDWPQLKWRADALAAPLASVRHRQGRLLGKMEGLGLRERDQATLKSLTLDVLKSSEIEGELLDVEQVRSSVARRLGIEIAGLSTADRRTEGVVQMVLEATKYFDKPLTEKRLFDWHKALFLGGGAEGVKIGQWRDDAKGAMQVVSGAIGRERVHFEAPPAGRLALEMARFLQWANGEDGADMVLKSAQAHFWFVTIHPFDDGNGRIARAIADWALARSESSARRFYSMSAQIRLERKQYYEILEQTQKGSTDVTDWLLWYLACLDRAIGRSEDEIGGALLKERFWKGYSQARLNNRQRLMLNRLLDGFEGKLTTTKWAKLTKCSQDSAQRDIVDLIEQGIMIKESAGGRSTSYALKT